MAPELHQCERNIEYNWLYSITAKMQEFKSNMSACYLGHFNIYMHKRPHV